MRIALLSAIAVINGYLGIAPGIVHALTIEDLTKNVGSNERLYENLELTLTLKRYSLVKRKPVTPNGKVSRETSETIHYTAQDGKFRVETEKLAELWEADQIKSVRVRLYNNHETKVLQAPESGAIGIANIVKGQADDENVVRPHMLLMRHQGMIFPLSVYLQGADAIHAYPYAQFPETVDLDIESKGEVVYKGLRCHVLSFTNVPKSTHQWNARYVLWLAEDRNYIPVRMEAFSVFASLEIPVTEGEVSEWRELKPGLWFPVSAEIVRYRDGDLKKHNRKSPIGGWNYKVEEVSLDPQHEVAYFEELEIPKGSAVYHVQDKKITQSYREGQPAVVEPKSSSWPWMRIILGCNVAVIFLGGVLVVRKRLRPRHDLVS